MNKKQKKMLIRIIVAAVLIVLFSKLPIDGYVRFGLFMIPYLVIGYDILQKAFKGIRNKQVFDFRSKAESSMLTLHPRQSVRRSCSEKRLCLQ